MLRRSKPTTVYECNAKACQADHRTIKPGSCYVSTPALRTDLTPNRRFPSYHTFHVTCFLAQHPGLELQNLKGYERNGQAAREQMGPSKTLWDFLEDD